MFVHLLCLWNYQTRLCQIVYLKALTKRWHTDSVLVLIGQLRLNETWDSLEN
jgi:hypothetical protein